MADCKRIEMIVYDPIADCYWFTGGIAVSGEAYRKDRHHPMFWAALQERYVAMCRDNEWRDDSWLDD